MKLWELVEYLDAYLETGRFKDYAPNGLQVEAGEIVAKIGCAVTASAAVIRQAVATGLDTLLVHHGYFWKGEDARLVGMKGRRVAMLMRQGISLLAYHLPLDAHPEVGNNVALARELGFPVRGTLDSDPGLVCWGELPSPMGADEVGRLLGQRLGCNPLILSGGEHPIKRIAWCTGAAADYIDLAAQGGMDAFVTGEVAERSFHAAAELGVHLYGCGHHATERFGVAALGDHLRSRFDLEVTFLDEKNPI